MATYRTRNGRCQATIRKGSCASAPLSETFSSRYEAEQWAKEIERRIDRGGIPNFKALQGTLVRDVLDTYQEKVTDHRKGWKFDSNRIAAFKRERWSYLKMSEDISGALRDWRDDRLKDVLPQSIHRDFNLLSAAFTYAMTEMGLPLKTNPVSQVKRPSVIGGERDVIWSEDDLGLFLDHWGWAEDKAPEQQMDFLPWALLIARATGMRRGEICSIEVDKRVIDRATGLFSPHVDLSIPGVYLPDTKNGDAHIYPLGTGAVKVLKSLLAHRKGHTKLLPVSPDVITTYFSNTRAELVEAGHDVAHLRFHDQRHTWTSEMVPKIAAKGGTQLDMLKITNRRTVKSLARYYNPKAQDLAKLLD